MYQMVFFFWGITHRVYKGIAAPQSIHRMRCIERIWPEAPRRMISIGCARCSGADTKPEQYAHGPNGILKTWFQKYRLPPGAVRIQSAADLEETYGGEVKELQREYQTEYKLCRALEQRTPPLYVGAQIMKGWMQKYGDARCARCAILMSLKKFSGGERWPV